MDSPSRRRIHECVLQLARRGDTIFGRNVAKFVQCTEESKERNPAVVMRNMRQFMSGIKNFLVRSGEGDLLTVIDEESKKVVVILKSIVNRTEFIFCYDHSFHLAKRRRVSQCGLCSGGLPARLGHQTVASALGLPLQPGLCAERLPPTPGRKLSKRQN